MKILIINKFGFLTSAFYPISKLEKLSFISVTRLLHTIRPLQYIKLLLPMVVEFNHISMESVNKKHRQFLYSIVYANHDPLK